jgi:hypothetical protein
MRHLALFLAAATLFAGDMEALLRYADPAASTWIGVEWAKIARTPHAELLRETFGEPLADTRGLEFVERLERLLVSATLTTDGSALLLLMEGKLDLHVLRELAQERGARLEKHRGAELLLAPLGGDGMDFAILGADKVALGSRHLLNAAIERAAAPMEARLEKVAEIARQSDVWSYGTIQVFSEEGSSNLLTRLRKYDSDPLARSMVEALDRARVGAPLELSFRIAPSAPPRKPTIRIYGLETGMREIEFR